MTKETETLFSDGPSDFDRREKPSTPYCQGGSGTCYDCVGSCGIEEYQDREAEPPPVPRRPRLRAIPARLMLAREMWARDHQCDYDAWDDDSLLSSVYERYIEKADLMVREAMARDDD